MSHFSALRAAPTPAIVLGFSGLLPFAVLTLVVACAPFSWHEFFAELLLHYGAVILSFVGALHWGYAVSAGARSEQAWMQYGWSVVPCLIAWMSLQLAASSALRLQAATLVACFLMELLLARFESLPAWMISLRAVLTLLAATCLLLASLL